MSLTKGALKQKLEQQKTVYGTCITANPPRWPKLVAEANLDFVFLDTEHIALDRSELSQMCNTYQALGLTPIVRIPKPDPFLASMAIDAGAIGVIACHGCLGPPISSKVLGGDDLTLATRH